jgi:hypothetical protein
MWQASSCPIAGTPTPAIEGTIDTSGAGSARGQGGVVIRKSRLGFALVLTLALGVTGIAYAGGGASTHDAFVDGAVTKKKKPKLSPKKFKKVDFMTGVRTTGGITGTQANPAAEKISFGKNIKFKSGAAPTCSATFTPGSTPSEARAACPGKSFLGSGTAAVFAPDGGDAGSEPDPVDENIVVSAFNGPGSNQIRLHTYSVPLGPAAPTVQGFIVNANEGKKYGKALSVPLAPETGPLMITQFNANITKSSGVVRARCKAKKFLWKREVTYEDSSTDTATLSQKCKKKKKKK